FGQIDHPIGISEFLLLLLVRLPHRPPYPFGRRGVLDLLRRPDLERHVVAQHVGVLEGAMLVFKGQGEFVHRSLRVAGPLRGGEKWRFHVCQPTRLIVLAGSGRWRRARRPWLPSSSSFCVSAVP